jgi:hypothetical protein
MTATETIIEKATAHARKVSENGMVFVYENGGVYWLALQNVEDGSRRTLMAVGFSGCGIRYVRREVTKYFEGK